MAKEWYYEDKVGYWQGPFEPGEMKKLASVGIIQKEMSRLVLLVSKQDASVFSERLQRFWGD